VIIKARPAMTDICALEESAELAGSIENVVCGAGQIVDAATSRVHASDVRMCRIDFPDSDSLAVHYRKECDCAYASKDETIHTPPYRIL
jgi:hypothetical protein